MRIARLRRIVPRLTRAVIGAIGEHNRFDIELYDFSKKLFEEGLRRNADAISERLATPNSE
jgi:hypothetical protein